MIHISEKSQCTGCTACQQICNHQAIEMLFDEEGHSYPKVDEQKCVNCGLCEKACPMLHKGRIPTDEEIESLPVYAVYNKDEKVRRRSTSGGLFSILAEFVISQGGVVYAARFDGDFKILHSSFNNLSEIESYRGSKYAQSDLRDTFHSIKNTLKQCPVLFVGTPCQVAGLKGFLHKEYENLYTCDFICMGISSPVMWNEYLKEYWKEHQIERIFFKDKRSGWHQWKMLVQYDGGKEYLQDGMKDPFFHLYLTHLSYRPSCFSCPFRTCKRMSDFTIADCWGIDKCMPEFDDNKGCTTLILQSEKSKDVFEEISGNLHTVPYEISFVKQHNPYINRQIDSNKERNGFIEIYEKRGFMAAADKYGYKDKNGILHSIKRKISTLLENEIKI